MNKKTGKPEQRAGVIHIADITRPQAVTDPEAAVGAAVDEIFRAMPEIVEAVITKAKEGSYLHANFLFNFAGAENRGHDDEGDDQDDEPGSLVELLMKRLDDDAEAAPHGLESNREEKTVNGQQ